MVFLRMWMRTAIFIALLMFYPIILGNIVVSQQSFSTIVLDIYYDLYNDIGYVNETIVIGSIETNNSFIEIPLLKPPEKGSYEIVSVTGVPGGNLTYRVLEDRNTILIFVNNTRTIEIDYMIRNYSDELSINTYTLLIDLSNFSNTDYLKTTLLIPGNYKTYVEPSMGSNIEYIGENVRITYTRPLMYVTVLYASETSETNIPGTTSPQTTSPTPASSPKTSPTTTTTETHGQPTTYNLYPVFLGIAAAIVIIATIYLVYRKKYGGIEIETLPPSILEDETSKKIIELAGEAGDKGIKQSELVAKTGRPKSSISRRVKRLADEGYIVIVRAGKHNIIKLSDKGWKIYNDLKKGEEK